MGSVVEKYYTHTTEGHNKDYRMFVDYGAMTLECHWGPIGGAKQVDKYALSTKEELDALVVEKHVRRLKHGYTDMGMKIATGTVQSAVVYELDIAEMIEAERLGA